MRDRIFSFEIYPQGFHAASFAKASKAEEDAETLSLTECAKAYSAANALAHTVSDGVSDEVQT